jgi:hypothetical protein
VEDGGAWDQGRLGVEHGGQGFVLHLDRVEGRRRGIQVHRCDGGHGLTRVADALEREDRLVPIDRPHMGEDVGTAHQVGRRQHDLHARQLSGPGDVDPHQASVRLGGAQQPRVEHARQADVDGVRNPAGNSLPGIDHPGRRLGWAFGGHRPSDTRRWRAAPQTDRGGSRTVAGL